MVKQYYDLDNKTAKIIAHNYIESGVELLLLKEHSYLPNKVKDALSRIDINRVAELLSSFLKINKAKFAKAISNYFDLINKYDLTQKENWFFFWEDLARLILNKKITVHKIKNLLDKSTELVKNNYQEFLNYSLKEGAKKV